MLIVPHAPILAKCGSEAILQYKTINVFNVHLKIFPTILHVGLCIVQVDLLTLIARKYHDLA
jgi:hypothetical protein